MWTCSGRRRGRVTATVQKYAVPAKTWASLRRRQLVAGVFSPVGWRNRGSSCLVLDGLRHDDDAVGVADDEVAGHDGNAAAADRHVDLGDLAAALRIERGDAAVEDREAIARIARTSRTMPSVTQPAAPRARDAVDSSAPHGAMRREPQHRRPRSRRLEVVDQRDLQLVGVLAGRRVEHLAIEAGAAKPASTRSSSSGRIDGRYRLLVKPSSSSTLDSTAV